MPSTKQFEYMDLSLPFVVKKMDMYEMAKDRYNIIIRLFSKIEELKGEKEMAMVEVPNDDGQPHYRIWKNIEGNFVIYNPVNKTSKEYEPINFFNWCFEKAPFMTVVGTATYDHPMKEK